MPVLTLSMIVKNEEKYLRGCLESVSGLVDELIIVDTGSTDKTLEIAKEFGAKIFHYKWINDFSAARNYALKKSTGKWILYLDADERLDENSIQEVKSYIKRSEKIGCFCSVNSIDKNNGAPNIMNYPRLFRNSSKLFFTGKIHEQLLESLQKERFKLLQTNINIIHLGYNVSLDELRAKAQRNLDYLLLEYKRKNDPYLLFQISQTYGVLGDLEKSVASFREILKLKDGKCPNFYKGHANRFVAAYELKQGNVSLALEYALAGQKYDSTQPILNKITAEIYLKLNNHSKAIEYVKKALTANKNAKSKEFEIMLDSREIFLTALKISTFAKDKECFNMFYDEYFFENPKEVEDNSLIQLIRSLLNNTTMEQKNVKAFCNVIDESNLEIILELIEKYPYLDVKIALLEGIISELQNRYSFYKQLGMAYQAMNLNEKARIAYEKAIMFEYNDPSVLFFLISIYVGINKFERIPEILWLIQNKFSDYSEVMKKMEILKSKLKPYLK